MAYDQVRTRLYGTTDEKLFQYDVEAGTLTEITGRIPADQFGNRRVFSAAVDPHVVYACGTRNTYSTDTAVVRSTDAGQIWQVLTRGLRFDNASFGLDGGREAITLRVHPKTRVLFVGTGCYGLWTFGPPAGSPSNGGTP
mgnify:CR=1 FL=1